MHILIIHYHLRPGGVTKVIESQITALNQLGHRITIASSSTETTAAHPSDHLHLPQLDYRKNGTIPAQPLLDLKADLIIIHNPTLGLNNAYPELVSTLAHTGTPLLLQCHDFAEDGRPDNHQLNLQNTTHPDHLFPTAPHIHYLTINQRDHKTLQKAGLSITNAHYLPNPITPPKLPKIPTSKPHHNLIFYPVRGIRRKNLGEICLLAAHAPENTRFAIALRSTSEEPAHIHDNWVHFAKEQNLPIDFDVVANEPDRFPHWLAKATHIITTSISEGFGLTFLEPAFLNKPLIGRNLPAITTDFPSYGTLYQDIPIPISIIPSLESHYRDQLTKTMSAYQKALSEEQLTDAWQKHTNTGTVDFGNLPEPLQRDLIKNHPLPELTHWLKNALTQPPQNIEKSPWTLENYVTRLQEILTKTHPSPPSKKLTYLNQKTIQNQFLSPAQFHFLRTTHQKKS